MEQAAVSRSAPARVVPLWVVGAAFWLLVLLVVVARSTGLAENETVATFGVIFTSIVVEALPFVLLGAAASAAIAVWVPARVFARMGALPAPLQVPAAAVAGFAMPVCECGSVPVARRLILRGLRPSAGIAFMLAAPILNPIVLASTWVAYGAAGRALDDGRARGPRARGGGACGLADRAQRRVTPAGARGGRRGAARRPRLRRSVRRPPRIGLRVYGSLRCARRRSGRIA